MILVVLWDIMGKDEHFWWIYLGIYIQESNRVLKHGRGGFSSWDNHQTKGMFQRPAVFDCRGIKTRHIF